MISIAADSVYWRTAAMTECERETQRKSKRPIEHFVSIALFVGSFDLAEVIDDKFSQ